jgi:hypothetical protein
LPENKDGLVVVLLGFFLHLLYEFSLPAELLAKNYASHTLDVIGAHEAIKKIVQSL